jgi:TetR/AcrR family transcriptional regulator
MAEKARTRLPADERRDALLDAARAVFTRSGLAGATMRDIGREAGVDPAIVYRHFASKEDIFDAALARPLEAAVAEWTQIATDSATYVQGGALARDQVDPGVARLSAAVAGAVPMLGAVLFSDRGPAFYRDHLAPALEVYISAIEESKSRWEHRDYAADIPAIAIVGASLLVGLQTMFGGGERDFADFARELNDLVIEGLAAR